MFTIGGCTTQIQRTVVASTMIESKLTQTWDGHFFTTSTQESTVGKSIEKALHHAAELNRDWVGVTESSAGTRWLEKGSLRHFPGFKVKTVGTLGAVDVFHGIFALGLAEGNTEENSVCWAAAAASLYCSRSGGRKAIPEREEINNFLKNNK